MIKHPNEDFMLGADLSDKKKSPIKRTDRILYSCNTQGVGLEIGPSYNPVAPKKEGYDIEILDHASAKDLRRKYRNDVDVDGDGDTNNHKLANIEEVDYVWTGQALDKLTGKKNYYDYIIASHVIEHTPNLVTFLQQCQSMLKPGGVLALAVPDRRYCFDYLRPNSTAGQVLQAWHEKRVFHTPGTIFDFCAQYSLRAGTGCWEKKSTEELIYANSPETAAGMMALAMKQEEYIDAHNWCFTPASFRLVMLELINLSLIEFYECSYFSMPTCEFIVSYRKGERKAVMDRMTLSLAVANGE